MNDRTEIACMIAEWWHNQKEKKRKKDEITTFEEMVNQKYEFSGLDIIDSQIVLERFMKIDSLNPLEISEDYSQLTIRSPDGHKHIIQKFREPKGKFLKNKKIELISPVNTLKTEDHCCNTCQYEAYYRDGIDEEIYGREITFNRRECLNHKPEAVFYFKDHCQIKLSKNEIFPVKNCPFWKQINGSLPGKHSGRNVERNQHQ